LRQLHTLSAEIEAFAPERYAAAYVTALGGPDALAPGDRALAAELITLARAYGERFAGETLCHNDLVADNVIDGSGLHLIDFEYAALSSPILDLASLAVMNDYSDEQAGVLIYTYHQREAVPFSRSEFAKVTRLVRLLGYFWARAEQARRGDHAAFSRFLDIPRQ
jgi:thiamine kinase-like enzyme